VSPILPNFAHTYGFSLIVVSNVPDLCLLSKGDIRESASNLTPVVKKG